MVACECVRLRWVNCKYDIDTLKGHRTESWPLVYLYPCTNSKLSTLLFVGKKGGIQLSILQVTYPEVSSKFLCSEWSMTHLQDRIKRRADASCRWVLLHKHSLAGPAAAWLRLSGFHATLYPETVGVHVLEFDSRPVKTMWHIFLILTQGQMKDYHVGLGWKLAVKIYMFSPVWPPAELSGNVGKHVLDSLTSLARGLVHPRHQVVALFAEGLDVSVSHADARLQIELVATPEVVIGRIAFKNMVG